MSTDGDLEQDAATVRSLIAARRRGDAVDEQLVSEAIGRVLQVDSAGAIRLWLEWLAASGLDAPEPLREAVMRFAGGRGLEESVAERLSSTQGTAAADMIAAAEAWADDAQAAPDQLAAVGSQMGAAMRELLELVERGDEAALEAGLAKYGLPSLADLLRWAPLVEPAKARRRRRDELQAPLPEHLPFTADHVHQAKIEALCHPADWRHNVVVGFGQGARVFEAAYETRIGSTRVVIGYPRHMGGFHDALAEHDTLALQTEHALWARWFERADQGQPWAEEGFVQLCEDAGLTKNKGGYRPAHRRQLRDVYESLTRLELYAERPGMPGALIGALWQRGLERAREDSILRWAPGEFFSSERWRQDNRYLGHVSQQILRLSPQARWAVRIAADLAIQARLQRKRSAFQDDQLVTVVVRDQLRRTGLAEHMSHRPNMQRRLYEAAYEELARGGCIADHDYGDAPVGGWLDQEKRAWMPRELLRLRSQLPRQLPLLTAQEAEA